jgi:hypothetical protein
LFTKYDIAYLQAKAAQQDELLTKAIARAIELDGTAAGALSMWNLAEGVANRLDETRALIDARV